MAPLTTTWPAPVPQPPVVSVPSSVTCEATTGSGLAAAIVSGPVNSIVSVPEPVVHSPGVAPEGVSVLAALIASRRVQVPVSAVASAFVFTVIVAAPAVTGAASAIAANVPSTAATATPR
jgi:hypothetical protein